MHNSPVGSIFDGIHLCFEWCDGVLALCVSFGLE